MHSCAIRGFRPLICWVCSPAVSPPVLWRAVFLPPPWICTSDTVLNCCWGQESAGKEERRCRESYLLTSRLSPRVSEGKACCSVLPAGAPVVLWCPPHASYPPPAHTLHRLSHTSSSSVKTVALLQKCNSITASQEATVLIFWLEGGQKKNQWGGKSTPPPPTHVNTPMCILYNWYISFTPPTQKRWRHTCSFWFELQDRLCQLRQKTRLERRHWPTQWGLCQVVYGLLVMKNKQLKCLWAPRELHAHHFLWKNPWTDLDWSSNLSKTFVWSRRKLKTVTVMLWVKHVFKMNRPVLSLALTLLQQWKKYI